MLLAHGAGSSPEVVRRLLAPCLPHAAEIVAPPLRGGADASAQVLADAAAGREVVLAAGVSMGAHALVLLAARSGARWPLVLAMPAWTGAPGEVAAMTAVAAQDLAREGRTRVLDRLAADPSARDDWIRDELVAGWSTYADDAELLAALRAAAVSTAPTLDELRTVRSPAAVVALADDPLHPAAVAEDWARTLPRAALRTVGRHDPRDDRAVLGRAAADALAELSGSR